MNDKLQFFVTCNFKELSSSFWKNQTIKLRGQYLIYLCIISAQKQHWDILDNTNFSSQSPQDISSAFISRTRNDPSSSLFSVPLLELAAHPIGINATINCPLSLVIFLQYRYGTSIPKVFNFAWRQKRLNLGVQAEAATPLQRGHKGP